MSAIRILIVEDNELFATRLEVQISTLGYEVAGLTDNSEDALSLILSEMPDLILMDINIQGNLDGISVAEKIKKLKIPILFITATTDKDFYDRAKKTAYIGYLVKPFDKITLQSAIEFGLSTLNKETQVKGEMSEWKGNFIHNNHFLVRHGNKLRKLTLDKVLIISVEGNYCNLLTRTEKFVLNTSLSKIMKILPEATFIRIHKKFIVQVGEIDNIFLNDSYVEIAGQKLAIGRTFKEGLMKRFNILT